MTWHSEYGQDRWLVENVFGDTRDRTFVEAGALDGLLHSNTLHFERELGWRGVLIEANPELLPQLRRNRPLAQVLGCALARGEGVAEFDVSAVSGWSGLCRHSHARRAAGQHHVITVATRPLAAVLRDFGVISVEYLSLDVEGAEFEVLSVYPFEEIPIRVIGVEDNDADNNPLRELLVTKGYRHLARVGVDEFWRLA